MNFITWKTGVLKGINFFPLTKIISSEGFLRLIVCSKEEHCRTAWYICRRRLTAIVHKIKTFFQEVYIGVFARQRSLIVIIMLDFLKTKKGRAISSITEVHSSWIYSSSGMGVWTPQVKETHAIRHYAHDASPCTDAHIPHYKRSSKAALAHVC